MKWVLVSLAVFWVLAGGGAAVVRGDFQDGNCSSTMDTVLVVVMGPINFAVPETLNGTCIQPL
jgi:hypothetical protein